MLDTLERQPKVRPAVASLVRDNSEPSPSLCHTRDIDQPAAASAALDASDPPPSLFHTQGFDA